MSMNISTNYRNLSSGYIINSAADDAAGLSITQRIETEKNGYDIGVENAEKGNNVLNVAAKRSLHSNRVFLINLDDICNYTKKTFFL